ncbi:6-phosphogluconate dehydrogenase [Thelonectria olida]|uniref:2-dehydropantoate 2-reductase n=1 Tax=Thelonectria olida TaxID=1576542 RepID=A0A9P9AUS1_9HYPO|nr:6-phosphogluconate dehydrogenase [Thelonectria olida]
MDKARVLLVGSGGIGTMAALNLEYGGRASVTAVLRSNYNAVKESGFTIHSVDHGEIVGFRPTEILPAVPDAANADTPPFDYIVCATKNIPDVPGTPIADLLRPAVTPGHTAILLLQNGLNIELPLMHAFPINAILSGISMCGSAESAPGVVEHKLLDDLGVGPFRPDDPAAADKARDFVARYGAGGRCSVWYDADVSFSRWRKLLFNAVINPTCAITNLDSGDMQLCPGLVDEFVRPAMREIVAAAAAYGHELTEEMVENMITSDPIESHIPPSMLTDVRKEQYIEVENLVGEPLRAAKARNVPTPTLENLYSLTRSYQWKLRMKRSTQ